MEKYLDECIKSVLNQTYKNFEILLVDDGSIDNSKKICENYASYSCVKTIYKKNGGLVSAWKKGVEACDEKSTHILFIDPDDFISKNYLKELIESDKNNSDILISKICKYYSKNEIKAFDFKIKSGFYNKESIKNRILPCLINNGGLLDRGISITRWGKLIKKNLVVGYMNIVDNNITFGEDFNLMIPIFLNANSIYIHEVNETVYFYRIRKDSMLRGYDKNMFSSIRRVYRSLLSVIQKTKNPSLIKQISIDYIGAMILCYKNNLYNPQANQAAINFIDILHNDNKLQDYRSKYSVKGFNLIDKFILFSIECNNSKLRMLNFYLLKKLSLLKRSW